MVIKLRVIMLCLLLCLIGTLCKLRDSDESKKKDKVDEKEVFVHKLKITPPSSDVSFMELNKKRVIIDRVPIEYEGRDSYLQILLQKRVKIKTRSDEEEQPNEEVFLQTKIGPKKK
jgi:hypothetical protein